MKFTTTTLLALAALASCTPFPTIQRDNLSSGLNKLLLLEVPTATKAFDAQSSTTPFEVIACIDAEYNQCVDGHGNNGGCYQFSNNSYPSGEGCTTGKNYNASISSFINPSSVSCNLYKDGACGSNPYTVGATSFVSAFSGSNNDAFQTIRCG